jgi:hypothetical protein
METKVRDGQIAANIGLHSQHISAGIFQKILSPANPPDEFEHPSTGVHVVM